MTGTIDLFGPDKPAKQNKTGYTDTTKKQKEISLFETNDLFGNVETSDIRSDKDKKSKTKQNLHNEKNCSQLMQSVEPICKVLSVIADILQKQESKELGHPYIEVVSMYIRPCVYFDCIVRYTNIDNVLTGALLEHMERFLRQLHIVPVDSKTCRILLDAGLPDTFITELRSKLVAIQQQKQFSVDVLLYTDRTEFDKHIKQCSIQQNKDFAKQFITNFDRIYDCIKQCLSNTKAQNSLLQ